MSITPTPVPYTVPGPHIDRLRKALTDFDRSALVKSLNIRDERYATELRRAALRVCRDALLQTREDKA